MRFEFDGARPLAPFGPVLVGVVASGNLEVLVEATTAPTCSFAIETSARGFDAIWAAVLRDFHERHRYRGLALTVHDMGATPAVVALRLDQAVSGLVAAAP